MKYGAAIGSRIIANKNAYMDTETWLNITPAIIEGYRTINPHALATPNWWMIEIIDGFGELFRQLSYNKIGTSTIQSRAIGAIINHTFVFALPGSPGACKDAWDDILQYQLDIRHKPCNFIELMPRLNEY